MLIEDAVSSGTPQFVIDSYATLAERAKTQSFGLIEEDVIVLDTPRPQVFRCRTMS